MYRTKVAPGGRQRSEDNWIGWEDGKLRQAVTPRKDVRQDADGDGREDNCNMLNACGVCAAECQRGGDMPTGEGLCCHCMT